MKESFLPPSFIRPALLGDVQAPGILLNTDRHGAPFLVAEGENDPVAIFLGPHYRFESFKRGGSEHWSGLAIENIQIEVDVSSAINLEGFAKPAGMMVRRNDQLLMTVVDEGPFKRVTEVVVHRDLPAATLNQVVGFTRWQAAVRVGDDRVIVWQVPSMDEEPK